MYEEENMEKLKTNSTSASDRAAERPRAAGLSFTEAQVETKRKTPLVQGHRAEKALEELEFMAWKRLLAVCLRNRFYFYPLALLPLKHCEDR